MEGTLGTVGSAESSVESRTVRRSLALVSWTCIYPGGFESLVSRAGRNGPCLYNCTYRSFLWCS